jgi:hypothetical protein
MQIPKLNPSEIGWEILALVGTLCLTGFLALAFRLAVGVW